MNKNTPTWNSSNKSFPSESITRLKFKVAETKEELEQVYLLLKATYSLRGSGFSIFHALPTSSILICTDADKVLSTLTIVNDSSFKLPIEKDVRIKSLKKTGSSVAEISDLANQANDIRSTESMLYLLGYAAKFSEQVFNVHKLLLADTDLSKRLDYDKLGFECLTTQMPFYSSYYSQTNVNLYYYSTQNKSELMNLSNSITNAEFPDLIFKNSFIPTMSPALMNYFFRIKSDIFSELDELDALKLQNFYLQMDSYSPVLPPTSLNTLRSEVRYQASCEAVLLNENAEPTNHHIEVVSLAKSGIGFLSTHNFKKGKILNLRVEIGSFILTDISVKVSSTYENMTAAKIIESDHYWKKYLDYLERNRASTNQSKNTNISIL